MSNYTPVIGLEIHVELKTKSKMFCQCNADYFGKKPNTNTCPVCLGLPGALPVPNRKAVEWTIKIGKALNCHINAVTKFDRKHYFYPDLPKGYQISQYDEPIATKGQLDIKTPSGETKKFGITRVHLEEDTGKLIHSGNASHVNFNRSGVPLVEIVTEPDFTSSEDVKQFLEELHTIIRYLGVSDADMEKGSMRMEPNISLKVSGETGLPTYKVEVKNINSFNFVKRAIEYEIKRQSEILDRRETPPQETRGYNEAKGITVSQRSKEEAHDYRYFPEPDIPPLQFEKKYIDDISVSELPSQKVDRYIKELSVKAQDAFILTRDVKIAKFFEEIVAKSKQVTPQQLANIIVNKRIKIDITPDEFVAKAASLMSPKETNTSELQEALQKVIGNNAKAVADFKSGKESVVMFLVGQVMREMKGKADAIIVREELIKKLKS